MSFKILYVWIEPSSSYHDRGALLVNIRWTCNPELLSNFGLLQKYARAQVVPDPKALEAYWENTPLPSFEDESFSYKSPYDIGLIKNQYIEGLDHIREVEGLTNTYEYREYLADCYITRAAILQIAEMKHQMETGVCIFGDFPKQAGCFRSGDALSDFAGLLKSIDLFWD